MQVCALSDNLSRVVVDDILRASGVSRATFYSYFTSADDAINSVGGALAEEFVAGLDALRRGVEDPVRQIAIAHHLFLARAAMEPGWGAYMGRWNYLGQPSETATSIVRLLKQGRRDGDFSFISTRAAIDFVSSSVIGAARRLVQQNGGDLAYVCEVQEMILTGLGAPRARARDAVVFSTAYLEERQAQLPWWRPLEPVATGG